MEKPALRQLPDYLLARGQFIFTLDEAQQLLDRSPDTTRRGLSHLRQAGKIFSPARSFWVVIPPEFRSWKTVPPPYYIDAMMSFLQRSYYVSLLTAAELHNASHQAPQAFQVMCEPRLPNRKFGRVQLRFYTEQLQNGAAFESRNTPTGIMNVATREQTIVDQIALPGEAGGLNNIATVLKEIGKLSGLSLAKLTARRNRTLARRVGWMVENFGHFDDLEPLHQVAAPLLSEPVVLRAGAGRRGHADLTWGVRINTDIEPDI